MRLGLSIADFSTPAGPACLGPDLARVAATADQLGFSAPSVMDL
jgi:hypothetical protein